VCAEESHGSGGSKRAGGDIIGHEATGGWAQDGDSSP
jgi:hypothetical protein